MMQVAKKETHRENPFDREPGVEIETIIFGEDLGLGPFCREVKAVVLTDGSVIYPKEHAETWGSL